MAEIVTEYRCHINDAEITKSLIRRFQRLTESVGGQVHRDAYITQDSKAGHMIRTGAASLSALMQAHTAWAL
ncbi:hypothetical protein [Burkholderia sp. PU8-34]